MSDDEKLDEIFRRVDLWTHAVCKTINDHGYTKNIEDCAPFMCSMFAWTFGEHALLRLMLERQSSMWHESRRTIKDIIAAVLIDRVFEIVRDSRVSHELVTYHAHYDLGIQYFDDVLDAVDNKLKVEKYAR